MLNIRWTQAALQDMKETVDYISRENRKAAQAVARKIHQARN